MRPQTAFGGCTLDTKIAFEQTLAAAIDGF